MALCPLAPCSGQSLPSAADFRCSACETSSSPCRCPRSRKEAAHRRITAPQPGRQCMRGGSPAIASRSWSPPCARVDTARDLIEEVHKQGRCAARAATPPALPRPVVAAPRGRRHRGPAHHGSERGGPVRLPSPLLPQLPFPGFLAANGRSSSCPKKKNQLMIFANRRFNGEGCHDARVPYSRGAVQALWQGLVPGPILYQGGYRAGVVRARALGADAACRTTALCLPRCHVSLCGALRRLRQGIPGSYQLAEMMVTSLA